MTEEVKFLNDGHFDFLKDEFNLEKEKILSMNNDDLEELYEKVCDIESDEAFEACENDSPISQRGKTAADIVTILGDYYRKQVADEEDEAFYADLADDEEE